VGRFLPDESSSSHLFFKLLQTRVELTGLTIYRYHLASGSPVGSPTTTDPIRLMVVYPMIYEVLMPIQPVVGNGISEPSNSIFRNFPGNPPLSQGDPIFLLSLG